jgi:hypothetical protein
MTDPQGAVAPYPSSDPASSSQAVATVSNTQVDRVIQPTAIAGPKASSVHEVGEVLKTMIHQSHFFATENLQDEAMSAVDKFVKAFTMPSELNALLTGNERAAKEDVTKRIPPGGPMPPAGPAIDYRLLAEAIVAAQNRRELEK